MRPFSLDLTRVHNGTKDRVRLLVVKGKWAVGQETRPQPFKGHLCKRLAFFICMAGESGHRGEDDLDIEEILKMSRAESRKFSVAACNEELAKHLGISKFTTYRAGLSV